MSTPLATQRIVLGMTLHNHARHLREAVGSLLAQTRTDFVLLMLDDGSTDGTEAIARDCERRDARVRYVRHESRQGMVATWREVAERGWREFPNAEYFAWASDHDRWHPEWLARLTAELDANPSVVLAYPMSAWMDEQGRPVVKRPRRFETRGLENLRQRWSVFCRDAVGAGDMVYGLMRIAALRSTGVFHPVLRPDRLLIAQLTLQGEISQLPETLWTRRIDDIGSVARQPRTLIAGRTPWWFALPPWIQHAWVLYRSHHSRGPGSDISRGALLRMVTHYQLTYTRRHIARSQMAQRLDSAFEQAASIPKVTRHVYAESLIRARITGRQTVGSLRRQVRRVRHEVPSAIRAASGRLRRVWRHRLHDALVLSRRLGLRGGSK